MIIVNKDSVLLVTIAFVRARWCEAPPSELRYRSNCNCSPRELQKIFFCTYGVTGQKQLKMLFVTYDCILSKIFDL